MYKSQLFELSSCLAAGFSSGHATCLPWTFECFIFLVTLVFVLKPHLFHTEALMLVVMDLITMDAIPFTINQSLLPKSGPPSPDPDAFKIL